MPYTTVTTGQNPTASFLNTNYRDQVVSTVTAASRPSGTEGQVIAVLDKDRLEVWSGSAWVPVTPWGSAGRNGCVLTRAATQSIPTGTGTFTAISWDTETTDTDGYITATSDTITIPSGLGGLYTVTATASWASSPGANSSIEILVGGAEVYRHPIGAGTQMTACSISVSDIAIAAANTVKVRLSQGSGAAINITATLQMWRTAA